ncbi:MAG: hypothetical protein FWF84_02515 [Kiritimatiellaeota bacterium]|nr:hypothetical protein [Kiritimatiellota bacterium]
MNNEKYDPNVHHRRSLRLREYDYSQAGMYFITVCVQGCPIHRGESVGADLCVRPPQCTPTLRHIHPPMRRPHLFGEIAGGVMALNDAGKMIEKWCVELSNKFSDITVNRHVIMPNHVHAILINHGTGNGTAPTSGESGEHTGSPLRNVVQWFKTMTTNEYIRGVKTLGWRPFDGTLWQRNYYEHIIRNETSYREIAHYVWANPANWEKDALYGGT